MKPESTDPNNAQMNLEQRMRTVRICSLAWVFIICLRFLVAGQRTSDLTTRCRWRCSPLEFQPRWCRSWSKIVDHQGHRTAAGSTGPTRICNCVGHERGGGAVWIDGFLPDERSLLLRSLHHRGSRRVTALPAPRTLRKRILSGWLITSPSS